MAEVKSSGQSRVVLRPAIVDENNNVVGMGTAVDITVDELMANVPGQVTTVVAGTGITVDASDPNNPEISFSGDVGVTSVTASTGITVGGTAAAPTVAVTNPVTPTIKPTITVGMAFDQTELQGAFDVLITALVTAGVLTV